MFSFHEQGDNDFARRRNAGAATVVTTSDPGAVTETARRGARRMQ
jgi:hypothetical protein